MKVIKLDQYDSFRCVGGECPYTCCAYWRIDVDEESDRFYRSCTGEFGEYLNRYIVRDEDRVRMELINGHCALLNEDGLCRIQLEYGEEKLSETCKNFPRRNRVFEDVVFRYMRVSCPEVVRELMEHKRPLKLLQAESTEVWIAKGAPNIGKDEFDINLQAFHIAVRLLQDRACDIAQRQRLFYLMSQQIQENISKEDYRLAKKVLRTFSDAKEYRGLALNTDATPDVSSMVRLLRCACDLVLPHSQFDLSKLFAFGVEYLRSDTADFGEIVKYLRGFDEKKRQIELENILISFLFGHYLSAYADRNLHRQAAYIIILGGLYRFFCAILSAYKGHAVPQSDRILIITYISRFFEHAGTSFLDQFDKIITGNNFSDYDFLFHLTK